MEDLLEQVRKVAEGAEVFSISHIETDAVFEANRLKHVQSSETSGRALRIIKNGRIGFAASNKMDGVRELVDIALEMAPFGAEARFEFPSPGSYPEVEVYDPEIESVTEEVEIFNSRGGRAAYKKGIFGFGVEGVLIRGTDMLFVGDTDSSCHPLTDTSGVIGTTVEQLERARETAPAPVGQLPVIFTPVGVAAALMAPLAMAVNGKTVLQGASPLGSRLGEQVLDSRISIWDDATIDYRPGSRLCDGEGVPSQRTPIIEGGVVANFLYDLQTAALAGRKSTGSGSRGLATLPSPSPSTVVVENGDTSFGDMLADIKEGLIVEQLLGATQGNILGGDFSGNILLGYAVKNGKITGRVKDTMISGNIYDALKEVAAIGNEGKWVAGRARIPHLYCPRLAVSKKD
jgi:PmbA protein